MELIPYRLLDCNSYFANVVDKSSGLQGLQD